MRYNGPNMILSFVFLFVQALTTASSASLSGVTIAVLDSGIDLEDKTLSSSIELNLKEIPGNQKDDDRNGYRDDVHGWNFLTHTPTVSSSVLHGNLILKEILEVNPSAKIIPIVAAGASPISPDALAKAIRYAIERGARVINLSFAINQSSSSLKSAIELAYKKNVVIVAAAGAGFDNPFSPVDLKTLTPQSHSSVIVVGMSLNEKETSPTANYGRTLDFVVAPATLTNQGGKQASSFAAARVSGWVQRILTKHPKLSPSSIESMLKKSCSVPSPGNSKQWGAGVLNETKLLEAIQK